MRTNGRFGYRLILLGCVFVFGAVLGAFAARDEEQLAGDSPTAQAKPAEPAWQEPEAKTGPAEKVRPLLKLPEVVVKGEKQFQVTAERRDLLLTDPMAGAKEMPLSVTEVAMPGFDPGKAAPAAETLTAKSGLWVLEAGAGNAHWTEGALVAGQEFTHANYSVRLDYDAQDEPAAYGFQPFGQQGSGSLDVRTDALPGTELTLSLTGQGDDHREPEGRSLGWGDWLQRGAGEAVLRGTGSPWNKSTLSLEVAGAATQEQGSPDAGTSPLRETHAWSGRADFTQTLERMVPGSMELLLGYSVKAQTMDIQHQPIPATTYWEALRTVDAALRVRPAPLVNFEFGVRLGEFQGADPRNSADLTGQLSLVLPTHSVLYALAEPELRWQTAGEWIFQQPYPTVAGWLVPEHIYSRYRAGWRQTFAEGLSTDLSVSKQDAADTPVWVPAAGNPGLFTLTTLPLTHLQAFEAQVEVHYLAQLDQTFKYTYQRWQVDTGAAWPYQPTQQGGTELKWHANGVEIAATYTYLGERYGDPAETAPGLGAAHVLGLRADVAVTRNWNVFGRIENALGYNWSEWEGYPARGVSGLGGVRLSF